LLRRYSLRRKLGKADLLDKKDISERQDNREQERSFPFGHGE